MVGDTAIEPATEARDKDSGPGNSESCSARICMARRDQGEPWRPVGIAIPGVGEELPAVATTNSAHGRVRPLTTAHESPRFNGWAWGVSRGREAVPASLCVPVSVTVVTPVTRPWRSTRTPHVVRASGGVSKRVAPTPRCFLSQWLYQEREFRTAYGGGCSPPLKKCAGRGGGYRLPTEVANSFW